MMQSQLVWFTVFHRMNDLSGWGNSIPLKVYLQICHFFYSKSMLQNGGCNRKSTVLGLKDGDNIVLKFIPELILYSLVKCTLISLFFCSPTLQKTTSRSKFSRFFNNLQLLLC